MKWALGAIFGVLGLVVVDGIVQHDWGGVALDVAIIAVLVVITVWTRDALNTGKKPDKKIEPAKKSNPKSVVAKKVDANKTGAKKTGGNAAAPARRFKAKKS